MIPPLFFSTAAARTFAGLFLFVVLGAHLLPGRLASAITLEVWYAPEDEPLKHVIRMYAEATRYIFVSVYGLTSPSAVKALVEAKKRGLDVRVITDRQRLEDEKQLIAVSTLQLAGIPIRVNRHDGLMHLKQVVIDDEVNTNGSMNHTTSGNRYNDERLDVIRDHAASVKAREKFLSLWKDEERFRSWREPRPF
jgi:phosphatidylserine/phosphatidylglycerophosphate/cardiolipin synthase-like enzyme